MYFVQHMHSVLTASGLFSPQMNAKKLNYIPVIKLVYFLADKL